MGENLQPNICTVGDISFAGVTNLKFSSKFFESARNEWTNSDFVIGNLESPLLSNGDFVNNKCVLKADPGWAKIIKSAGINMVSLANNHLMDYGPEGLFNTIEVLKETGLYFVGAGKNKNSALAPCWVQLNGQSLAFLGRSSVIVSSPCYASESSPGVAYLDENETKDSIIECKKKADKVVLLIHWGVEHYHYPTPAQRKLAKELIHVGADLILGHHPHVLQGIERIGNGLICYSLGNFLFNDIEWSFFDEEGQRQKKVIKLTKENRKGGMLKTTLSDQGINSYKFIPTHIEYDGTVKIQNTLERQREFSNLCSRLHWPAYSFLWRLYSLKQEWKLRLKPMTIERLNWTSLKKIRPKHFRQLLDRVRRSAKISTEKSTNPYE